MKKDNFMYKVFLIFGCVFVGLFSNAQQDIYHDFQDLDAIYIYDENKTYFVENIIESVNSEGSTEIMLIGIKAKMEGNHIAVLTNNGSNLKPIVKSHMHRKDVNPLPGTNLVTCVNGGVLCVILFKRKQFPVR